MDNYYVHLIDYFAAFSELDGPVPRTPDFNRRGRKFGSGMIFLREARTRSEDTKDETFKRYGLA